MRPKAFVITLCIISFFLGATTCAVAVHAQAGGHGRHGDGSHLDFLARELDLDEQQTVAVGVVVEQTEADFEELLEQTHAEARKLHDGAVAAVRALLDPDQIERFDEIVEEMEERHGADRHRLGGH